MRQSNPETGRRSSRINALYIHKTFQMYLEFLLAGSQGRKEQVDIDALTRLNKFRGYKGNLVPADALGDAFHQVGAAFPRESQW